jgi:hypothetical protein
VVGVIVECGVVVLALVALGEMEPDPARAQRRGRASAAATPWAALKAG